ncbi:MULTISPECIES: BREX-1 system adenine-specific DNA-methyltransferase PglX [unclassified Azospirillum]|uniref:BREX-1 system adenine-specific DNA-methyltransferase PglX n=1 Tax=unclassified Azospirillum TaxID=2630922 RepID=UPI000B67B977|nr:MULTISPECIES: BREX-1 system adenine-specific DNA-methyltransferase PglX [unclassified Azospirillum]SNT15510.1 Type II restriction/modification system, DNA methylase subunit YeeA [Azospirillum sp. RU38E]SNT28413.1 Type II restriction/modification system, DNA methylase subunit YeeA [Azospirillum sp. RU37A]
MDTNALKKFAQAARNLLLEQVEVRLTQVLSVGSAARREHPRAVGVLEAAIAARGQQAVVEQVAYTWFNRFSALRFMDMNGYTSTRTVSPADGQTRPELLSEAMAGHIDEGVPATTAARVRALLDGASPSDDPQGEAYRLLLVAACNQWHETLPFLFERIDDYTELLMPADLLSATSILARVREAMDEDACQDVEVIGWLYQFYISEKKDQVFAGLKKNIKITAENIPAATQLFTPHWIVRYLVENSLGRLWLLNRPHSTLAQRMDYYIAPVEPEEDFLRIDRPQDIRLCDPACGSGHMLTYAFDLLFAIYEEEGYDADAIPALILTHNLYGLEIDDRAGALAAFALSMKAAARLGRRRFLRLAVQPQICVMEDVRFGPDELRPYMAEVGHDLFTADLRQTLEQFGQAKNFGSLIIPALKEVAEVRRVLEARNFEGNLFLHDTHRRVLTVLRMADFLSQKYHVVVANPPYMGNGGMNSKLKDWVSQNYKTSKLDMMTCFMERSMFLLRSKGYWSMLNIPTWMFGAASQKLRGNLVSGQSIISLLHIGRGLFGSDFGTVAFCLKNSRPEPNQVGTYLKLFTRHVDVRRPEEIRQIFTEGGIEKHVVKQTALGILPGTPFAYWVSPAVLAAFQKMPSIESFVEAREGLTTGSNDTFMRNWHEVSCSQIGFSISSTAEAGGSGKRWFPYLKGGEFNKWYGNHDFVVNWYKDGIELREFKDEETGRVRSHNYNGTYGFREGFSWSGVTSGKFSSRYSFGGCMFDAKGPMGFSRDGIEPISIVAFLNSSVSGHLLGMLSPNLDYKIGQLLSLPLLPEASRKAQSVSTRLISLAKSDWDAYETSWDFTRLPLLAPEHRGETLAATYTNLRTHWQGMTDEMQRLEEENNRIFIDAYGLQDELTPEVPLAEITLTCNPAYRYGGNADMAEREERLRADTVRELISYAVGCMFGRYSLDAPGLILANQGEGLAEYLERVPDPRFLPDRDNVIPVLDGDWFADDITERFRLFLRLTFGEERFLDNLAFVEGALGGTLRRYFTRDFFTDHVKRYKKRPIYWLFSSPKGSFQALIYMHRYRPDTVSVMLNDYLREFIRKLTGERERLERLADDPSQPQAKRTKAVKDGAAIAKMLVELTEWERDTIFPLAQQQIEIDLDDGVKANYPKFGPALKKIAGLEATDD